MFLKVCNGTHVCKIALKIQNKCARVCNNGIMQMNSVFKQFACRWFQQQQHVNKC